MKRAAITLYFIVLIISMTLSVNSQGQVFSIVDSSGFLTFVNPLTNTKTYLTSLSTTGIAAGGVSQTTLNDSTGAIRTSFNNDYRAANFVAGTNYLAPNGSAAALTSFPTFNQNTTGTAAGLSATLAIGSGGTGQTTKGPAFLALAPTVAGNANKYLKVNAGATDYELVTLAGGGDLLAVNNLSDLANAATARTNLSLGNVTNESKATMFTSPTFTGTPVVPGYLVNTTTSGVAATATASGTTTVTHNLGRTPTTIRIKSISSFTSNAAATPVPFSEGTWNSTGNRCLYMVINGTTTQVSQTSTVFSVIMVTSAGNRIEGVIGNVGATTFDIVWTETGTHTAGNYLWEAQ